MAGGGAGGNAARFGMASKRRIRRKACEGKARHLTAEHAMIALRKTRQPDMNVYRCRFCGGYHIGHLPKWMRRGKQAAMEDKR